MFVHEVVARLERGACASNIINGGLLEEVWLLGKRQTNDWLQYDRVKNLGTYILEWGNETWCCGWAYIAPGVWT